MMVSVAMRTVFLHLWGIHYDGSSIVGSRILTTKMYDCVFNPLVLFSLL